jgi:hypothetical protein
MNKAMESREIIRDISARVSARDIVNFDGLKAAIRHWARANKDWALALKQYSDFRVRVMRLELDGDERVQASNRRSRALFPEIRESNIRLLQDLDDLVPKMETRMRDELGVLDLMRSINTYLSRA